MPAKKTSAQLQREIDEALTRKAHATKRSPARSAWPSVVGSHALGTADVRTQDGAYWIVTVPKGYRVDYKAWGPSAEIDLGTFTSRQRARAKITEHAGKRALRSHAAKIDAGSRKPSGRQFAQAAKKANDEIYDLLHNKYFQSIPNDEIFAIVKRAGFRFDPIEEEFILVGRDGKATWQLHDEAGREVNHMLVLQWHKLDRTGRYEVVAYVS